MDALYLVVPDPCLLSDSRVGVVIRAAPSERRGRSCGGFGPDSRPHVLSIP
jgi:hypothetical protein